MSADTTGANAAESNATGTGPGARLPDPGLVRTLLHGVRHGQVFDLAQPVSPQAPHLPVQPPFQMTSDRVRLAEVMGSELDTEVFAEHVHMTLHVGTHIDALGHFAAGGHCHGGAPAAIRPSGAGIEQHGIESVGPIIARAVLIDVATWAGVSCLEAGTAITAGMLQGAARALASSVAMSCLFGRAGRTSMLPTTCDMCRENLALTRRGHDSLAGKASLRSAPTTWRWRSCRSPSLTGYSPSTIISWLSRACTSSRTYA